MSRRKLILGIVVAGLALLYGAVDPSTHAAFPRCPFLKLSGYQCPGCGAQRAIHAMLHGDIRAAWAFNPLLMLSIPYLLLGAWIDAQADPGPLAMRLRRSMFGPKGILVVLLVVIGFWILRNLH